jgi:hypothetical protein
MQRPREDNIFGKVETDSARLFAKSLRNIFVDELTEIKHLDNDIAEKNFWNDVLNLKGNFYQKPVNIADLIQAAQRIQIDGNSAAEIKLKKLLSDFVAIQNIDEYKRFIGTPSKSINLKSSLNHSSHAATLFGSQDVQRRIESEQIDAIKNTSVEKKEMVQLLMVIASPANYNGHLIDFENDISSRIDLDDFAVISDSRERLLAIENKRNKFLAEKIDSLVVAAKAENKDRLSIILKTGGHYTAIDIDIKMNHLVVMDAAQDLRAKRVEEIGGHSNIFKKANITISQNQGYRVGEEVIRGAPIQKAEAGCSIFALVHSFAMAKENDFHAHVLRSNIKGNENNVNKIDWVHFSPEIVYMSQSTKFIEYYNKLNPRHENVVMKLTNNNKRNEGFERSLQLFKEKILQHYADQSLNKSQKM